MALSIAGVVVVVPSHLRFLRDLVCNLNEAHPGFDHVLIIASGFSRSAPVLKLAKRCAAPRLTVFFVPLGSAGRNRNYAWDLVDEDLICFMDGDDLYWKNRNAVIQHVFESTDCDLFLHGFREFDNLATPKWENISSVVNPEQLVFSDELTVQPERDRSLELSGGTASTNLVFRDAKAEFAVQHAHVTVRARIGNVARFHEVFGVRNEDGVFAQDVLESGAEVVLSPEPLSLYRQGARAKPKKNLSIDRFFPKIIRRTSKLLVLR